MVRAAMPAFSMAVSSASAFMTVARMPIMSPVTRGIPVADILTPRTMLPPPTTTAIATPSCRAATKSAAMRSSVGRWMPKLSEPMSASPEPFTTTRRNTGVVIAAPAIYRPRRGLRLVCHGWGIGTDKHRSLRFAQGSDLTPEIIIGPVDALTQRVAHEACDLDRAADLALGFPDGLGHALVRFVDEGLIEQAYLLVEGLEP